MSITASYLVVAVVLLRLILKKAPKIVSLILWTLVGIRLIVPISLESIFSLIPSAQTVPPDITTTLTPSIHSGLPLLNSTINPIISQSFTPTPSDSVNPLQVITSVATIIWVSGIAVMLLYALVSYIRLKIKVREAVKSENNVMLCDNIASPFILGVFRPRIYIPSSLNGQDLPYVLAHENAHLSRCDHLWKPLGFLLLSVYWFNPVLWVAYILLCRDIELACDERVIKKLGIEAKKPYSTALVNCSVSHKALTVCPLAFGEVGVKKRVKTVLNYKKPAFWIIVVALILCIVVAVCFLTNPTSDDIPTGTTTTTTTNQNTTTTTTNNSTTTTTKPNSTSTTVSVNYGDVRILGTGHYYNIDGDRYNEFCMIMPVESAPYDLFRIVILGNDETRPKYYAIYSCGDMHTYRFVQTPDGKVKVAGINNDLSASDVDITLLDIGIENGRIVLSRDGKVIEPLKLSTNDPSNYYFDFETNWGSRNYTTLQLHGNSQSKEETVMLGYMMYAPNESEEPKTYWMLCVVDYDNPEATTYIPLGAHEDLGFFKYNGGTIPYGELPKGSVFIVDEAADQLYAQVIYQDGGYTITNQIG